MIGLAGRAEGCTAQPPFLQRESEAWGVWMLNSLGNLIVGVSWEALQQYAHTEILWSGCSVVRLKKNQKNLFRGGGEMLF